MTDTDAVRIAALTLTVVDQQQELSAEVDGERVWFRFPLDIPVQARVEAFLPLALQEAMVRGVPVVIDPAVTVSSRVASQLPALQRILCSWNDEDFHPVAIDTRDAPHLHGNAMVLSAYSGGIDSSYTYACHRQAISHLLLVQGFDGDSDADSWQQNVAARHAFANAEGKILIPVASNVRRFIDQRRLSWGVCHGSLLGALGVTLAARTFYIPSSFTYNELFPWGSHPMLDPLWSSEWTTVVHHGLEASRTAKTAAIADQQTVLDFLQVCWRGVAGNCGNCPKCVRTSLALHLLGKTSARLPAYHGSHQLRWLKPGNHASMAFTEDLIQFSLHHGADGIARTLRQYRRRFLLKYHASELAKLLFGNSARALARRLWPKTWHHDRARLQATRSWLLS